MTESGARYRNLAVWQHAHRLVIDLYRVSRSFPSEERYGLTSQLRRAASSIAMNLAEGASGESPGSYAVSVDHALRSAGEVDYQLLLARDLGYLDSEAYRRFAEEIRCIRAMLAKLYRAVKRLPRATSAL
ncbi:MAG: four helix bundle protein [Gemmatimonadaceae bacterium]|nr:four helix bundle protein [Gemmatimonadaceae bacterium]NUQ94384.1 four helix bundle protein [Gemmatimonadaceae bacterium]NUR19194.1 four helix bundle protein [Gemmatimonadaceae bacterium]NUS96945.1 four helix bundle protein [Gemmatimonadaceae bacterium]